MSECVNEYFIVNDEIAKCSNFKESYIKNGKLIYEVIRIIEGIPLYLERHLDRLDNSCKIAGCKLWISNNNIENSIYKLVEKNNIKNGNVKLIFNFGKKKIFLAYFIEHSYPDKEMYDNGVKTILYHGERNNPNAKIIDNNFRNKVNIEIKKNNAYEAILVDRNGYITEGSRSNIFFIKNDKLITSPIQSVLPGVTRQVIIELCKNKGIYVCEDKINYKKINEFDASFISGTSPKVLPISYIDDIHFNSTGNALLNFIKNIYDIDINTYINNKMY